MKIIIISVPLILSTFLVCFSQPLHYPATKKVNQVDDYFGTKVADPYRWLEDDTSAAVAEWVREENAVTASYFDRIPFRSQVKERLQKIYDYPKYSAPSKHGDYYLFGKNEGLQNQPVLYVQHGLDGPPQVLIDPNKLSEDGTTRLADFSVSNDNKYVAYSLSKSGSDWQEIHFLELATGARLPDVVPWVKVSGLAWLGNRLYYSRYDAPEAAAKAYSAKNENHKVYVHVLGTDPKDDQLVFSDPQNPQRFHFAATTDDERFLILDISDRGKGKDGDAFSVRDMKLGENTFKPIVTSFDDQYDIVDNVGDQLIVLTNRNAPNRRVVSIDTRDPEESRWKTILPEKPEPLESVSLIGGKLIATYLKDVSSRVYVYDLNGKFENEIALPTLGTVGGFKGKKEETKAFYYFTSFTFPLTIYEYDVTTAKSTLFRGSEVAFKPDDYETQQVFYPSKDGTKIPMFIVHKKTVQLHDSPLPTLLYGYGGFNITLKPGFDPLLIGWLEQGCVYAQANLRGGGEYGEKWHEAGMKLNKQNVFDDFVAAAKWLIDNKITSHDKLVIEGGSNGGLLMGAVTNQHPELFRAVHAAVGVMDMLRFQKFTIGWNWIPDFGSSQDSVQFTYLYSYSPLQNIREGVEYPSILVTTADHDDRVVPAHSFKYAATMQEKYRGQNPVVIRIETRSGHGSSSTSKEIEETADAYSFFFYNLGVTPKY